MHAAPSLLALVLVLALPLALPATAQPVSRFAVPSSPSLLGTDEALGMRAEHRADPKPLATLPSTFYEGAATQGERLWVGVGFSNYAYGHPLFGVEPRGGGLQALYVTEDGALADLPPLGTPPANPLLACHEGTALEATDDLVYFLVMDGACSPAYSFVLRGDGTGAGGTFDTLRIGGEPWSSGAKHHAITITESGRFAAIHAHSSRLHRAWPNIAVSNDLDHLFHVPESDHTGPAHLVFKMGAVGERIYVVSTKAPVLSVLEDDGTGRTRVRRLIHALADFWGGEYDTTRGFGATARYIGPAADAPGFVIYTSASSRLDYWPGAGRVVPVDEQSAWYMRGDGATYRLTHPDLAVQRLIALDVQPDRAVPTWRTEGRLDLPEGWGLRDVRHAEMTSRGSIWLIGARPATFPGSATANDIAVAYYPGGR